MNEMEMISNYIHSLPIDEVMKYTEGTGIRLPERSEDDEVHNSTGRTGMVHG